MPKTSLTTNKIYKLKRLGLLFVGVLFSYLSYSQENYLPGFVIKNNGDTLKGFIDYRNWGINPRKIDFKSTNNSGSISFKPTDIKEFSVKDEIYVSGIIDVENTTVVDRDLEHDSQIRITIDTTFLQTLIKGGKGLYYYRNSNGRESFYVNKEGGFELLVYKKYLQRQGTTDYIIENKAYMGQLNLFLIDCATIRSKIENASYSQSDLIKLFQNYYKCSSSKIGFQRKAEKVHFEIGALAGVSLTNLKFNSSGSAYDYLEGTNYELSTNPLPGLFFDLIMPRNLGKLSLDNELMFSMYKTNGQYEYTDFNNDYFKMTTQFGYAYLKINTLIRYKFPIGTIIIFCNGGISNGILVNEKMYLKKEITKVYSGTTIYEGSPLVQTKHYEQGFIFGTGIKYKKLSFEARLEKGDGMINVPSINAWVTRYCFLLGYRFK